MLGIGGIPTSPTRKPTSVRKTNIGSNVRAFAVCLNCGYSESELTAFKRGPEDLPGSYEQHAPLQFAPRKNGPQWVVCRKHNGKHGPVPEKKLARLRTPSDVYHGSLRSMIAGGLKAAVARTFGPGRNEIDELSEITADLKPATAEPDLSPYTRQIDAALCLVSAIAFEMICLRHPRWGNLRNHIGSRQYGAFMRCVQRRVKNYRGCGWDDNNKFENGGNKGDRSIFHHIP